jgi:monovalent cation/hydrogen antiporter
MGTRGFTLNLDRARAGGFADPLGVRPPWIADGLCENRRMTHPAEVVGFALAVVAVTVVARGLADRFRVPYAIVLTGCGLIYAVLPLPAVHLDPEIVLWLIIPPLLYAAALRSSLVGIRADWRPISSLSVLLVLVTAVAVGWFVDLTVPRITLAAGLTLGAAVAPPDPVASLAIGRRAGLPSRMLTLIGGEGMLNDATALTTLQVAVAATVSGVFSVGTAIGQFVLAVAGGLLIGMAFGYLLRLARPLLRDPLRANAVSLATPFAAYLAGEAAHVSGVLCVIIAGLMAGHDSPRDESGVSRLQTDAVWQLIEFVLEGVVFLLIGAQLPTVLRGLRTEPASLTASAILVTLAGVLLVRPLWLFLTQSVPRMLGWRLGHHAPPLTGREVIALSWAGTRGVITLAAMFSVPLAVSSGAPFPDRDLLLLCAYIVVLVTLVGQGLTFGPLLRRLGLKADEAEDAQVRHEARLAAIRAALRTVDDMQSSHEIPASVANTLRASLRRRAERHERMFEMLSEGDGEAGWSPELEAGIRAQHAAITAQREELVRWRDGGRLSDDCLRTLQHELDHEESVLPGG